MADPPCSTCYVFCNWVTVYTNLDEVTATDAIIKSRDTQWKAAMAQDYEALATQQPTAAIVSYRNVVQWQRDLEWLRLLGCVKPDKLVMGLNLTPLQFMQRYNQKGK